MKTMEGLVTQGDSWPEWISEMMIMTKQPFSCFIYLSYSLIRPGL